MATEQLSRGGRAGTSSRALAAAATAALAGLFAWSVWLHRENARLRLQLGEAQREACRQAQARPDPSGEDDARRGDLRLDGEDASLTPPRLPLPPPPPGPPPQAVAREATAPAGPDGLSGVPADPFDPPGAESQILREGRQRFYDTCARLRVTVPRLQQIVSGVQVDGMSTAQRKNHEALVGALSAAAGLLDGVGLDPDCAGRGVDATVLAERLRELPRLLSAERRALLEQLAAHVGYRSDHEAEEFADYVEAVFRATAPTAILGSVPTGSAGQAD